MNKNINILYLVGAVIIFLIVLLIFQARMMESSLMKGFWKADIDFCQSADLELFVLYLGSNVSYGGNVRYGYILAKNEEGLILNNPIKIKFSNGFSLMPGFTHCKKYNVEVDWQETDHSEDTFPSYLSAAYYPSRNKLVFYNGDTVYAILYKDSCLSCLDAGNSLVPDDVKITNDTLKDTLEDDSDNLRDNAECDIEVDSEDI